jgi:uncharacterized repeat protein (TIGR03943 family)
MKRKFSQLLAALTLSGWGGIFIYFYGSGRIAAFLHPFFQPWVLLAGVLMVMTGGVIFFSGAEDCGHEHGGEDCCGHDQAAGLQNWKSGMRMVVLLFPLMGAALFSPDQFGEVFVKNRKAITLAMELPGSFKPSQSAGIPPPMPISAPQAAAEAEPEKPPVKPVETPANAREVDLMDLVYTAGVESEREQMEGEMISVTGQVVRDQFQGLRVGNCGIYRLIIVCCAADARPISIRIDYLDLGTDLKNTDWVKVTGKIHFLPAGTTTVPLLRAIEVSPVAAPEEGAFTP